ncbi:RNA-binding S4 domain-containing protein [Sunxiuqinia elliptica]|uniref:Heat shock protein Hsp15 n=1 Tax=Sunxiuqinia elliptica TaxID=655355 RepID=A0A4R6HA08_9BACT|nr:RNA-binding S4 domain-containing protein [Sunxiuqinia elliptica]TDO05343.1 heat shock protein Hsp15 [Sunxiuqinia elliptica]TDO64892.1 heat shock protein Hsp15 [Sunxiuqinia elliptica]
MGDQVRVDKWLWAVRVFKTRSIATDAVRKGRVMIDDLPVKPSRVLKVGDVVQVRKSPITYRYRVLKLAEKRMGAKLVDDYVEDITPQAELEVLEVQKNMGWFQRERGTGRPTKKERRDLDNFFEND